MSDRPESGPMRFGNDWTGLFLRGDNAYACSLYLRAVIKAFPDNIHAQLLEPLAADLAGVDERTKPNAQQLLPFAECLPSASDELDRLRAETARLTRELAAQTTLASRSTSLFSTTIHHMIDLPCTGKGSQPGGCDGCGVVEALIMGDVAVIDASSG